MRKHILRLAVGNMGDGVGFLLAGSCGWFQRAELWGGWRRYFGGAEENFLRSVVSGD